MSQGSLIPKIRFLGQKMCFVARERTDGQTHTVTTVGTLSGFQEFFLQPIIKDRPNKNKHKADMQRSAPEKQMIRGIEGFQSVLYQYIFWNIFMNLIWENTH